ncbi:MAG: hypothetical protein A2033_15110 [Bacteroidetes bacterium GWA2_31_9]|nr:MAG: hypothetical protein A2033_15110 [Bacteroidetes bacterium GWA2_31_9]
MNVDTVKVELIDWIARLNDKNSINKLLSLKKKLSTTNKANSIIFGSGKHLIEYISDDFNDPIEEFKENKQTRLALVPKGTDKLK